MTDINKQKFLAELAKLLTFMYEEDRQEALSMYAGMFEEAEDEQSLLQALVSPTRQAVVIARAYNAKERKLQVHAQSRENNAESGDAEFVRVINQVRSDALREQLAKPEVDENQLTLFDDLPGEPAHLIQPEPFVAPFPQTVEPAAEPVPASPPVEDVSAVEGEPSAEEDVPAAEPEEEAVPAGDLPAPVEEAAETEAEPEKEAEEAEESGIPAGIVDEVDAFLADFTLPDAIADVPEEASGEEYVQEELIRIPDEEDVPSPVLETVRKPKIFLLILYILFAVPLTLVGVVLLLIPTLLFLALAACTISGGVVIFSSAFSGFAVIADMLVVLGTAIVVLALGLLFLWAFIWFIGGAIVGLIRGVVELGESWCYKEVPAE